MKPDGVIAFHVTNRFLNLVPVVDALATRTACKRCGSPTTARARSRAAATGCC